MQSTVWHHSFTSAKYGPSSYHWLSLWTIPQPISSVWPQVRLLLFGSALTRLWKASLVEAYSHCGRHSSVLITSFRLIIYFVQRSHSLGNPLSFRHAFHIHSSPSSITIYHSPLWEYQSSKPAKLSYQHVCLESLHLSSLHSVGSWHQEWNVLTISRISHNHFPVMVASLIGSTASRAWRYLHTLSWHKSTTETISSKKIHTHS